MPWLRYTLTIALDSECFPAVAVVFEARCDFERILCRVHHQIDLVVLHCCLDGVEADGNVLFASAKKAADGQKRLEIRLGNPHQPVDFVRDEKLFFDPAPHGARRHLHELGDPLDRVEFRRGLKSIDPHSAYFFN
jgi:hypothetical protein